MLVKLFLSENFGINSSLQSQNNWLLSGLYRNKNLQKMDGWWMDSPKTFKRIHKNHARNYMLIMLQI